MSKKVKVEVCNAVTVPMLTYGCESLLMSGLSTSTAVNLLNINLNIGH